MTGQELLHRLHSIQARNPKALQSPVYVSILFVEDRSEGAKQVRFSIQNCDFNNVDDILDCHHGDGIELEIYQSESLRAWDIDLEDEEEDE